MTKSSHQARLMKIMENGNISMVKPFIQFGTLALVFLFTGIVALIMWATSLSMLTKELVDVGFCGAFFVIRAILLKKCQNLFAMVDQITSFLPKKDSLKQGPVITPEEDGITLPSSGEATDAMHQTVPSMDEMTKLMGNPEALQESLKQITPEMIEQARKMFGNSIPGLSAMSTQDIMASMKHMPAMSPEDIKKAQQKISEMTQASKAS